jgi:hypothetical protein
VFIPEKISMKSMFAAGLMAALAIAPVASAQADVIYSFTQTSPTFRSANTSASPATIPLVTSFDLTVTDEAARNGFRANTYSAGGFAQTPQVDGILSLNLTLTGVPGNPAPVVYSLVDFTRIPLVNDFKTFFMSFSAVAGGLLNGQIVANSRSELLDLNFRGTAVSGRFFSNVTDACGWGSCTFTGVQNVTTTTPTPTPVPEPMSIALFGAGLAGLAVARHRKA